ncbi:hypothetical protein POLUDNITSA_00650 [Brevundimonas phage vB_BpoS-Poludnitsa]|nr:hypothetical protein POLUDNITSA_00650 [Brevundimonas phage vB_BpoS-Poludnitsa]
MREPTKAQLAQVGRAADEGSAAKMELDAATVMFEAACVSGDSVLMVKRGEAVQAAMQNWLDKTASKYEIVRRIAYGI